MATKKKPTKATKTKSDGSNERAEVRRQMDIKKNPRPAPRPDNSSQRAETRRQMDAKKNRVKPRVKSEYSQDAITRVPANERRARELRTANARAGVRPSDRPDTYYPSIRDWRGKVFPQIAAGFEVADRLTNNREVNNVRWSPGRVIKTNVYGSRSAVEPKKKGKK